MHTQSDDNLFCSFMVLFIAKEAMTHAKHDSCKSLYKNTMAAIILIAFLLSSRHICNSTIYQNDVFAVSNK